MVLVRTISSEEVRAAVATAGHEARAVSAADRPAADRQALRDWIRQAADRLARGLQAAGR